MYFDSRLIAKLAYKLDKLGLYSKADWLDSMLRCLAMSYEEARGILGVSDKASVDEINKAHRQLAFQHHPDRGGNLSAMQAINHARDLLLERKKHISLEEEKKSTQSEDISDFGFKWNIGWSNSFQEAVNNASIPQGVDCYFISEIKKTESPDHSNFTRHAYVVGANAPDINSDLSKSKYRVLIGVMRDIPPTNSKKPDLFRIMIFYGDQLDSFYNKPLKYDLSWLKDAFYRLGMTKVGSDLRIALLSKGTKFNENIVGAALVGGFQSIKDLEKQEKEKNREAKMFTKLFKLAYHLDQQGFYDEAKEIEEIMASLKQRTGIVEIADLVSMADYFDEIGNISLADRFDEMIKEAKTKYKTHKGKEEKLPKGAEHKAPKKWWDEQVAEIKKKNPDYSKKRISEVVGDIWDNKLSDEKRVQIYKRYGKTKNPNK